MKPWDNNGVLETCFYNHSFAQACILFRRGLRWSLWLIDHLVYAVIKPYFKKYMNIFNKIYSKDPVYLVPHWQCLCIVNLTHFSGTKCEAPCKNLPNVTKITFFRYQVTLIGFGLLFPEHNIYVTAELFINIYCKHSGNVIAFTFFMYSTHMEQNMYSSAF